ncbi:MAG TPA: YhcN/YlaJ family sporulation lipoprotein [Bacillota bacterium]|nr:YhcN/YlaJ family sporulation lipoprotein [Bacillota bacterium]
MKIKRSFVLVLSLMLLAMIIASCAPARRPGNQDGPAPGSGQQTRLEPRTNERRPGGIEPVPAPRGGRLDTDGERGPRTSPGTQTGQEGNMQQRAESISNEVSNLDEVESATCIITGNTAMVGVQFSQQYRGEMTDQIKKTVDRTVRDNDDRISRVVVTADPDLVTRIEDIFRQTGEGRPLSGFTKEVNELINRIQPR